MKRVALALGLVLAAAPARAQQESANIQDCEYRPIAGTVPYQTAILARQTHAAAFGVGRFLEQYILPELDDGANAAYGFRMQSLGPTTLLPSIAQNAKCSPIDRRARTFTTQTSASTGFGIGGRWDIVRASFLYAGNITVSRLFTGKLSDNFVAHVVGLQGVYLGLAAPAFGDGEVENVQSYVYDYMAGAEIAIDGWATARAGYVGSNGLYASASLPVLRLSADAILADKLADLAYLRAGLMNIDQTFMELIGQRSRKEAEAFAAQLGTSLFARGSQLSSGVRVDPTTGNQIAEVERSALFLTHHLHSTFDVTKRVKGMGIAGEVELAVASHPEPFFHLARVGAQFTLGTASVGYVKPPVLRFLGTKGEPRPFAVATAGLGLDKRSFLNFGMQVSLNDPDMVRIFPWAPPYAFNFGLFVQVTTNPKRTGNFMGKL